jgi:hypothetical protein
MRLTLADRGSRVYVCLSQRYVSIYASQAAVTYACMSYVGLHADLPR